MSNALATHEIVEVVHARNLEAGQKIDLENGSHCAYPDLAKTRIMKPILADNTFEHSVRLFAVSLLADAIKTLKVLIILIRGIDAFLV